MGGRIGCGSAGCAWPAGIGSAMRAPRASKAGASTKGKAICAACTQVHWQISNPGRDRYPAGPAPAPLHDPSSPCRDRARRIASPCPVAPRRGSPCARLPSPTPSRSATGRRTTTGATGSSEQACRYFTPASVRWSLDHAQGFVHRAAGLNRRRDNANAPVRQAHRHRRARSAGRARWRSPAHPRPGASCRLRHAMDHWPAW